MVWVLRADVKGQILPALFHDAGRQTQHLREMGQYRVTVEEEVSECCGKWQGFLVGNDNCRDGSRWLPVARTGLREWHWHREGPVAFCPECGKKL
jgi:hypothetical protein